MNPSESVKVAIAELDADLDAAIERALSAGTPAERIDAIRDMHNLDGYLRVARSSLRSVGAL
jgi:hypothetical protein